MGLPELVGLANHEFKEAEVEVVWVVITAAAAAGSAMIPSALSLPLVFLHVMATSTDRMRLPHLIAHREMKNCVAARQRQERSAERSVRTRGPLVRTLLSGNTLSHTTLTHYASTPRTTHA